MYSSCLFYKAIQLLASVQTPLGILAGNLLMSVPIEDLTQVFNFSSSSWPKCHPQPTVQTTSCLTPRALESFGSPPRGIVIGFLPDILSSPLKRSA